MKKLLLLLLLCPFLLNAQKQARDFSTFYPTRPIYIATTAPATCAVGDMFFDSDATAGQNIFGCTATNTWTLQGAAGTFGETSLAGLVNSQTLWDGANASRTLTFAVTGTDPVITFSASTINVSTGAFQVGGAPVVTSASALTSGKLIEGAGSQASAVSSLTATVVKLTSGTPSAATAQTDYLPGMSTGAGAASGSCTANAFYRDTTNAEIWVCIATNTWKKLLSTSDTGTGTFSLLEGTVCGAGASAGEHNVCFDSSDSLLKSRENGGSLVTYYSTANPQATVAALTTARAIYGNNFDGTAALTQIISSVYGGTGNGFFKITGPTTSEKTFTVPNADSTLTITVASGTKALDTDAISSTACDTLSTTTATGVASTDIILITPNADITGVTGYTAATTGGLQIFFWPTTNTINWKVCNPTSSSVTPGAVTLNYRVVR